MLVNVAFEECDDGLESCEFVGAGFATFDVVDEICVVVVSDECVEGSDAE